MGLSATPGWPRVKPSTAGRRLILLALPFLGFGLLWAAWPPLEGRLSADAMALARTLGVAMTLLSLGAITVGVWLIRRGEERIL